MSVFDTNVALSAYGHQSCQCINPLEAVPMVSRTMTINGTSFPQQCLDVDFTRRPFSSKNIPQSEVGETCARLGFGSFCNAWWGETFQTSCENDWCRSSWCFVDKDSCAVADPTSAHIQGREDLVMSYRACGNMGSYSPPENRFNHLKGSTIRIAYPDDIPDASHVFTRDDGTKDGAAVEFIKQILIDPFELNVEIVNRTKFSNERFTQSRGYTACVHDVGLGVVDLCIGSFFATKERLSLSTFSTPHYTSKTVLVLNRIKPDDDVASFLDRVAAPLAPFAPGTWYLMLFASFYMAISYRFIIDSNKNPMWSSDYKKKKKSAVRTLTGQVGIGFYNSVVGLSLTNGDVVRDHRGMSVEGRLLMLGYSVFAFMFMSAYTASFTLSLVSEIQALTTAQSLQGIAQSGKKICLLSSIATNVKKQYPFLSESSLLKVGDNTEIVNRLKSGLCDGGIMTETAYRNFRAQDLDLCKNTRRLDGFSLAVVGMPVSVDFLPLLNFAINIADDSLFLKLEEDFLSELIGPELCPLSTTYEEDDVGNDENELGLSIVQMFLPIITTLICSTLAILSRLYKHFRLKYRKHFSSFRQMKDDCAACKDAMGDVEELAIPELLSIVQNYAYVCPIELEKALDCLPDSTALVKLAKTVLQSDMFLGKVKELNSLSIYKLYNIIDDPRLKEQAAAALETESPKDSLISIILGPLTVSLSKELAVSRYDSLHKMSALKNLSDSFYDESTWKY